MIWTPLLPGSGVPAFMISKILSFIRIHRQRLLKSHCRNSFQRSGLIILCEIHLHFDTGYHILTILKKSENVDAVMYSMLWLISIQSGFHHSTVKSWLPVLKPVSWFIWLRKAAQRASWKLNWILYPDVLSQNSALGLDIVCIFYAELTDVFLNVCLNLFRLKRISISQNIRCFTGTTVLT